MGKTRRREPRSYYRTMSGRRRAIRNNARNGSIPPDPWDDYPHSRECTRWLTILSRMRESKPDWDIDTLTKRMLRKVKSCGYLRMHHWIRHIIYWEKRMMCMMHDYKLMTEI